MTITSVEDQKHHTNRKSVFIDGQYAFAIDEEDWFKLGLYVGKEMTREEITQINHVCNFSKAKKQALKYITFKMRTELEVRDKLEHQGFDRKVIGDVVDYLKKLEYIDDNTYAKKFIKDAIHLKKYGVYRIVLELQRRGISQDTIGRQLDNLHFDAKATLKPLLEKRLIGVRKEDEKALNRLRNYFIRRGYHLRDINECIDEVFRENEYDE